MSLANTLLTALYKYANDDARKRNSIPKYQVYNKALMTAYVGRGFANDRVDTIAWGRWVESAVGAHLMSMADELDYDVYYWREPGNTNSFHPKRSLVVGTGGVNLEDFLGCNLAQFLEI